MGSANRLPDAARAQIKDLAGKGLGPAAISREMALPPSTVKDHIDHPSPRGPTDWSDERVDLLKTLWGDGQSAGEIRKHSKMRGFSRSAIIGKVHRLGLNRSAELNQQAVTRNVRAARVPSKAEAHKSRTVSRPAVRVVAPGPSVGDEVAVPVKEAMPRLRELAPWQAPKNPVPMGDQKRGHCSWPIEIEGEPLKACNEALVGRWCAAHTTIGTIKESGRRMNDLGHKPGGLAWSPRRFLANRGGGE
jgi:hypothetical protein